MLSCVLMHHAKGFVQSLCNQPCHELLPLPAEAVSFRATGGLNACTIMRPEFSGEANTMTTLLLVRHAEVYNPDQILYGRLPRFRLSDVGQQQAERLAR